MQCLRGRFREEGVGRVVTGGTDFEDIIFLVRNEKAHKATVLRAILKPAHGFVVQVSGPLSMH